MKRALVVTPAPSHPADRGNRGRVAQMLEFLAGEGFAIDIVFYPMDEDAPESVAAMQAAWGGIVLLVPPSRPLHTPPEREDHGTDDWWDAALDGPLAWLCAHRRYDVMWVNYVFLTRAFRHARPGCLRVLDTHDKLSGRRALFEQHGARPEFFLPDAAAEAAGLDRADIVVAIKPSEAAALAAMTRRRVVTVPALPPRRPAAPFPGDGETPVRFGFIGADNEVNAVNLNRFIARLEAHRQVFLPELRLVIAGDVCRRVRIVPRWVKPIGPVPDLDAFYRQVDVVVAPIAFSTGLKIKVAEALARAVPVIATTDAFDGFSPADPYHACADLDAVCMAVLDVAADPARRAALAEATLRAAEAAAASVDEGLSALRTAIAAGRRRLVVVTDTAFWRRTTLAEERLAQAVDYLSNLLPVTVLSDCADAPADIRPLGPLADLPARLAALAAEDTVAAVYAAVADDVPPLDVPVFRDNYGRARGRDLVLGDGTVIGVTPLRHLPVALGWVRRTDDAPMLLLIAPEGAETALLHRLAAFCPGRVAILRTGNLATDASALAAMARLPMPTAFATLAADPCNRELVASLAAWCGAPSFHLGGNYPQLAAGRLVRNLRDHAVVMGDAMRTPLEPETERNDDAGWCRIWASLAA